MDRCKRTQELQAYHDGEVLSGRAAELEEHLEQCAVCAKEMGQLRRLSGMIQELRGMQVPADLIGRVQDKVCREYSADRSLVRLAGWLTAAAAAVLIAGSTLLWQYSGPPAGYSPVDIAVTTIATSQSFNEPEESSPDPEVEIAFWIINELSTTNGPQ